MVYTIEFQKRGLPDAHILIILSDEDKKRDSETVDQFISAEISDKLLNTTFFNIVTSSMVHGPFLRLNSSAP